MNDYESLVCLLEEKSWFESSLSDLPLEIQRVIAKEYEPFQWDALTPDQRRQYAEQHDNQNDPEKEPEREYWWNLYVSKQRLEQDIQKWESLQPTSIEELSTQESRLQELQNELETLKREISLGGPKLNENESPTQRKMRLEIWYQQECKIRGKRGAKARTAKREKITPQTLSGILNRKK